MSKIAWISKALSLIFCIASASTRGGASALDDPRGHVEWFAAKRAHIDWSFWRRYETWLEQDRLLPVPVVRTLSDLTDEILKRLEDPSREGAWDRRGMVVGSVQSGKTANYIGLICKAVDAGYRLVIVLAGLHNNLRSQTQLRIDEGFLGFDTEKGRLLNQGYNLKGVGLLHGQNTLHSLALTSCEERGDFRKNVANAITSTLGGIPTVLVVKKHGSILKNLREWLLHLAGSNTVRGVPMLLIDDEADQASINTKASKAKKGASDEESVSRINRRIREVLAAFEKCAYVGYTATPFANIFINPDARNEHLEDDIFPRSFILNVRPPSNYVGPSRVFGIEADPDAGIEGKDPLPIVNIVSDHAAQFPPHHAKSYVPTQLPDSLKYAIKTFILACAARRARGQADVHNSMLVHVTRFIDVQRHVAELIKEELDFCRRRIAYGEGASPRKIWEELQQIWIEEFTAKYETIQENASHEVGEPLAWDSVKDALHEAASRIEVKEINGRAKDALDYVNHPNGYYVIAVGGDKLSRGLTLEGLSVSYFLRTSRMYDTLMQMGRWFGYRQGYLDLCRLFTTSDLCRWYRHISLAEEELRREFEYMVRSGLTPEKYGLRVRSHSGGLIVTALNKMCHSKRLELSFAGELKQTAHFHADEKIRQENADLLESFLSASGRGVEHESNGKTLYWRWRLPAGKLCDEFLSKYLMHPYCYTVDSKRIIDFIKRQNDQDELTTWHVMLINNTTVPKSERRRVAGYELGLTERKGEIESGTYSTANANIQSPTHQSYDLQHLSFDQLLLQEISQKFRPDLPDMTEDQRKDRKEELDILESVHNRAGTLVEAAIQISQRRAELRGDKVTGTINGRVARELRPVTHGLLLIYPLTPPEPLYVPATVSPYVGLAFSFPTSQTARSISYQANAVLIRELQDGAYEED